MFLLYIEKYKSLLSIGQANGFTPVIIVPSAMMYEVVNNEAKPEGYDYKPESIIEKSTSINVVEYLEKRIADASPCGGDEGYDFMGEYKATDPVNNFASLIDYNTEKPYTTIIIAKIPTDKPWELAAWIPMGGFNACPFPEEQVVVFKYWYDKYGAVPAVVSYDTWEMHVKKPVQTKDEAMALALEQFGFCNDTITQGVGYVNAFAGTLINSSVWYFWWD